jgi:hypothetical protein
LAAIQLTSGFCTSSKERLQIWVFWFFLGGLRRIETIRLDFESGLSAAIGFCHCQVSVGAV